MLRDAWVILPSCRDIKAKCQGGKAFSHTRGQSRSSSKCFHAYEVVLYGFFFPSYQVKMYLSLS